MAVLGNCQMCGIYRNFLYCDHIVPTWKAKRLGWSKEQRDDRTNLQYICANCHQDKTAEEYKERGQTPEANERRRQANIQRYTDPSERERTGELVRQAEERDPSIKRRRREGQLRRWSDPQAVESWRDAKRAEWQRRLASDPDAGKKHGQLILEGKRRAAVTIN